MGTLISLILLFLAIASVGALFTSSPSAVHDPGGYQAHGCLAGIGVLIVLGLLIYGCGQH